MAVVASAPGKVLITGGYLVLEKPNAGIVLTTTARFYAIVKPLRTEIDPGSWAWLWTDVKLISPQLSKVITYKLSLKTLSLQNVTSPRASGNPFVEQAVQLSIAAAKSAFLEDTEKNEMLQNLLLQGIEITILGSNDFYSYRKQIAAQGLPLTSESLSLLPTFSPINLNTNEVGSCAPEVAKTGLGSSAAMTTAVVGALLQYLGLVNIPSSSDVYKDKILDTDLHLLHAISQAAHCAAQGKVGSGFDVSAAVYGSQRYVRFSPEILAPAEITSQTKSLVQAVTEVTKAGWDNEIAEYSLPPSMSLILGEPGYGGSCTPSMVGAVQAWRKKDPENAEIVWKKLAESNAAVESHLRSLKNIARTQEQIYNNVLAGCSNLSAEKWMNDCGPYEKEIIEGLLGARKAILQARSLLKQMGEAAGVPIEPDSQTQMLDATMNMEGVLLAGVPGAGGFDALFAITIGSSARDRLAGLWSSNGILPLLIAEDPKGVIVEEEDPRNLITRGMGSLKLQ